MFVKVCGITRLEDATLAVELGADALGFVFWPQSPRYVEPDVARRILSVLPSNSMPVGVFVNEEAAHVNAVASYVGLGAVQLHGDEPAEYCASIERLVIKAFAAGEQVDEEQLAAIWSKALLLIDAADTARRGGTGRRVDWAVAAAISRRRKTILAGGLRHDNVADAIRLVRPFGVDVSSGVESAPGIKDPRKLEVFLAVARRSV